MCPSLWRRECIEAAAALVNEAAWDLIEGAAGVLAGVASIFSPVDEMAVAGAAIGALGRRGTGAGLTKALGEFLGDGAKARLNKSGDLILQSEDELREVRFDFENFNPHDAPHVHVIEYERVRNSKVEIFNERVFPPGG